MKHYSFKKVKALVLIQEQNAEIIGKFEVMISFHNVINHILQDIFYYYFESIVVDCRNYPQNLNCKLIQANLTMLNLQTLLRDTKEQLLLLQKRVLPVSLATTLSEFNRVLSDDSFFNQTQLKFFDQLVQQQNEQKESFSSEHLSIVLIDNASESESDHAKEPASLALQANNYLDRIAEIISQLLSFLPDIQDPKNTTSQLNRKQEEKQNQKWISSEQMVSILVQLKHIVNKYLNITANKEQNNSKCSFNTDQPQPVSNSGSVRSLLTEKLKKAALEEHDPQRSEERIVVRGNLMRELRQYSGENFNLNHGQKTSNISQPYSVQPQPYLKISQAQMASWTGQRRKSNSKLSKRSQRTIFKQMNINGNKSKQKGSGRDNGSCAKCQIY